jgi:hypothetical protein
METDRRFPSGRWTGFWTQRHFPSGKHTMELHLTFNHGEIQGNGRDWVGPFTIKGRYNLASGRCHWIKQYIGRHAVSYRGFNEGKGIWGKWEIASDRMHGGFHIWPEGMPDPSTPQLTEAADLPKPVEERVEELEPALAQSRVHKITESRSLTNTRLPERTG